MTREKMWEEFETGIIDVIERWKKRLEQESSGDAVSRDVFEQVRWERDVAIEQLKELGYSLGEKVEPCDDKTVNPQRSETVTEFADRCRECGKRYVKRQTGTWIWNVEKGYCKCSECGIGMGHTEFDFCPNCGADMRGD